MKKLIWFVVLVLIALEAAKHPLFRDWVDEMKQRVISKASDTVGKTNLAQIQMDLSQLKSTISSKEMSYLTQNISTMAEAQRFKATYCNNKSQLSHSVLTGHAFEQACKVLNKDLE